MMNKMYYFLWICSLYSVFVGVSFVLTLPTAPQLLVISFDGFRWDYLDIVQASGRKTPNFDSFIENGSKAKWMKNSYITLTFPNHYTIATGLYEENHGVVGNKMYDPVFNEVFDGTNGQTGESKWWDNGTETWSGEPIWLTNQQMAGHRSGVYYWIGSEAAIRGQRPYHYEHYNWSMPYKNRVDTVMGWLANDTAHADPVNFAMLYFEEPDHTGHLEGPNSQAILDKVVEMDTLLGYIIQSLKDKQLFSNTDVIVTSDHGMAELTEAIYLEDYIDSALYQCYGQTPVLQILPKEGKTSEVYKDLLKIPNVHVYKKESIPSDYHYQQNRRIMPIVVEAYEGFFFCKSHQDCSIESKWLQYCNHGNHEEGGHGYNNSYPNMHPIFIAHGPSFKQGFLSEPFNNVDIYPLMCHLLGVKPAEHDGSLDNIKQILREKASAAVDTSSDTIVKNGILTAFGIVFGILLLFFVTYYSMMIVSKRRQHIVIDKESSALLLADDSFA